MRQEQRYYFLKQFDPLNLKIRKKVKSFNPKFKFLKQKYYLKIQNWLWGIFQILPKN